MKLTYINSKNGWKYQIDSQKRVQGVCSWKSKYFLNFRSFRYYNNDLEDGERLDYK